MFSVLLVLCLGLIRQNCLAKENYLLSQRGACLFSFGIHLHKYGSLAVV